MENNPQKYYQPPESQDDAIKKMGLYLTVFFSFLTMFVILVVIYAHDIAKLIPFSVEKRFVKPYEVIIQRVYDAPEEHPQIEEYLQELANKLSVKMALPESTTITIHYINDDIENAFATLGGHIFIYRGILNNVNSENALSMVIAHEISHIKNRDPIAAMGRGLVLQLLYAFTTGDYPTNQSLTSLGSELTILFFSREQEEAADIDALEAINAKYDHVGGFSTFFEKMNDKDNTEVDDIATWLSTHPDTAQRIIQLEEHIKNKSWPKAEELPLPNFILTHLKNENKKKATEK